MFSSITGQNSTESEPVRPLRANGESAPRLAVIGGGLAGIAAAEYAARHGFHVEIFDRSRILGGRAASLWEPNVEAWIDNGQHILMGCCTETLALHERMGLSDCFECRGSIPFADTNGKKWSLAAASFLPNDWQLLPAFLKMPFISFAERVKTGLTIRRMISVNCNDWRHRSFGDWLKSEKASKKAIDCFWAPLLYGALSDSIESVSFFAARKVLLDGFLSGRKAMSIYLPKYSLRKIYGEEAAAKLGERGVVFHPHRRVHHLRWSPDETGEPGKIESLVLKDDTELSFDYYITAIPSFALWKLLEQSELDTYAERFAFDRFESGAITTAHLWFDRPLLPTGQKYVALLGGPAQFLFSGHRADLEPTEHLARTNGYYHVAVISASHRLLSDFELTPLGATGLVKDILSQLGQTFPKPFQSGKKQNAIELLHHRVTTVYDAVFSPSPAVYDSRPPQRTPIANFALAGDWTQTGWPATLEGAVQSGQSAVRCFIEG